LQKQDVRRKKNTAVKNNGEELKTGVKVTSSFGNLCSMI
jgi:hypothetical protein